MVDVSNKYKSITVAVASNNGNTVVAASSDTAQYWANQSHSFAEQAKESVQEAKNYAELANSYIEGFENVVTNNTNNIIATGNDCINQLTELKEAGAEEINESIANGKDEINSTKTTILNDIEFVADGEKKEIEDLIDSGKEELKESIGDIKILTTLEIGDIGIAPLGIDETKGKRRYLNGQLIIQDQYTVFTEKLKKAVELYPSLACTEEEWQTTATMTVGGQVGKFVVDDNAGTIRLPKIIMPIQGLTDLSKLAEIVEAGLPNITGRLFDMYDGPSAGANGAFTYEWNSGAQWNKASGSGYHANSAYNFNASRSNPIYKNGSTVQQEQIQYPYFIQVATGAETEDNIINEIELNNPFSLLDYKYSEYELNNISWLRSNGQYNSKAIYPAVYDLLLKIYNGTETKAGVSVKLSTETFTDYDFVLNTADETFRLPIKVKLASGKAVVGNGKQIGFTNGTSTHYGKRDANYNLLGFGTEVGLGKTSVGVNFTADEGLGITTDPNNSGIETSDSDLYLYFYVGETVQNANLINAGRIEEIKANKTDVDGRWTFKRKILSQATALGNYTYDLSDYLPNDGYEYEVQFEAAGYIDHNSANPGTVWIGTEAGAPGETSVEILMAHSGWSVGHCLLKIGNRVLYGRLDNSQMKYINLLAISYRRLGTNR